MDTVITSLKVWQKPILEDLAVDTTQGGSGTHEDPEGAGGLS